MIGIYMIQCNVNNKIYIGSSKNIEKRWYLHKHATPKVQQHNEIYSDAKLYGWDNFTFSVIEECDVENIKEREIYWTVFYKSNYKDFGYNKYIGFGRTKLENLEIGTNKYIKRKTPKQDTVVHNGTGCRNSEEYRRKQSSESNRNRWKDGCPESTRQKMSESAKRREAQKREQNENGRTIL